MHNDIISVLGRLTAAIKPGQVGEVMIPENAGGSSAYIASAADPTQTIERGSTVQVTAFFPPRTVLVTRV